jgi:hypothetical protein
MGGHIQSLPFYEQALTLLNLDLLPEFFDDFEVLIQERQNPKALVFDSTQPSQLPPDMSFQLWCIIRDAIGQKQTFHIRTIASSAFRVRSQPGHPGWVQGLQRRRNWTP